MLKLFEPLIGEKSGHVLICLLSIKAATRTTKIDINERRHTLDNVLKNCAHAAGIQ